MSKSRLAEILGVEEEQEFKINLLSCNLLFCFFSSFLKSLIPKLNGGVLMKKVLALFLASSLFLTACSKKEEPQDSSDISTSTESSSQINAELPEDVFPEIVFPDDLDEEHFFEFVEQSYIARLFGASFVPTPENGSKGYPYAIRYYARSVEDKYSFLQLYEHGGPLISIDLLENISIDMFGFPSEIESGYSEKYTNYTFLSPPGFGLDGAEYIPDSLTFTDNIITAQYVNIPLMIGVPNEDLKKELVFQYMPENKYCPYRLLEIRKV